jgi:hypothetical protein
MALSYIDPSGGSSSWCWRAASHSAGKRAVIRTPNGPGAQFCDLRAGRAHVTHYTLKAACADQDRERRLKGTVKGPKPAEISLSLTSADLR